MKTDCEIIRDLMPLCAEQIASDKSRLLVEEHLAECPDCREAYAAMQQPEPAISENKTEAEHFRQSYQKQRGCLILKVVLIAGGVSLLVWILSIILILSMMGVLVGSARVEEDRDPAHYSRYMGENALPEYRSKWGMDESIFPETVTGLDVTEYCMVRYDPWDAQFISYLTVRYPEADYAAETARLSAIPATAYEGNYSVTAFPEGELLAMYADAYQGFVYAIRTPGQEHAITYVELIFCNYCYDLDYQAYIPAAYLPPHFNAAPDNPYEQQQRKALS
ncbi:MAG: zf-HC2 domain-containing protein [Oscillospiraceae bacterium]|nr:zf-HC2 domain-containing protein [Oscillospiraceae bacterium]